MSNTPEAPWYQLREEELERLRNAKPGQQVFNKFLNEVVTVKQVNRLTITDTDGRRHGFHALEEVAPEE